MTQQSQPGQSQCRVIVTAGDLRTTPGVPPACWSRGFWRPAGILPWTCHFAPGDIADRLGSFPWSRGGAGRLLAWR